MKDSSSFLVRGWFHLKNLTTPIRCRMQNTTHHPYSCYIFVRSKQCHSGQQQWELKSSVYQPNSWHTCRTYSKNQPTQSLCLILTQLMADKVVHFSSIILKNLLFTEKVQFEQFSSYDIYEVGWKDISCAFKKGTCI